MSLETTLLNRPTIGTSFTRKYTVGLQDIKAGGAFTTVAITLENLPAGAIHMASRVKHSQAVAGTSFSASTARLSFDGTALGGAALDVFAAPGVTEDTHEKTSVTPVVGKVGETNPFIMTVTSTGGNLSAATAGSIDAYIEYIVLS
jgi:hypothetical protein